MYRFTITGHKNILATHATTLEFTKEGDITPTGDCIVGVNASFESIKLAHEFAYPKVEITLTLSKQRFRFYATPYKQFSDDHELVFRKTAFLSSRTAGIYASRAAADIPRSIITLLRAGKEGAVTLKGVPLQYLFFDFDDTLCDFWGARQICHDLVAKYLARHYHAQEKRSHTLLDEADALFPKQASAKNAVTLFDRHQWFRWVLQKQQITIPPKEYSKLVTFYWDCMIRNSKPLPHAHDVLASLSKKYTLGLLTDADGKKEYKYARLEQSGLGSFFAAKVLGDELHVVKPDPALFSALLRAFKATPEQCVMIGDKPWADLLPAKKLGMITVWMKYGIYAKQVKEIPPYVDYIITDLNELKELF